MRDRKINTQKGKLDAKRIENNAYHYSVFRLRSWQKDELESAGHIELSTNLVDDFEECVGRFIGRQEAFKSAPFKQEVTQYLKKLGQNTDNLISFITGQDGVSFHARNAVMSNWCLGESHGFENHASLFLFSLDRAISTAIQEREEKNLDAGGPNKNTPYEGFLRDMVRIYRVALVKRNVNHENLLQFVLASFEIVPFDLDDSKLNSQFPQYLVEKIKAEAEEVEKNVDLTDQQLKLYYSELPTIHRIRCPQDYGSKEALKAKAANIFRSQRKRDKMFA